MEEMNNPISSFSRNTQEYPDAYACILKEMICGMMKAGLTNSISHSFIVQ